MNSRIHHHSSNLRHSLEDLSDEDDELIEGDGSVVVGVKSLHGLIDLLGGGGGDTSGLGDVVHEEFELRLGDVSGLVGVDLVEGLLGDLLELFGVVEEGLNVCH
eukprot:TRINITY_DN16209_c0_g1_i2.p1 TRINITY_DN16209_c0_g1~~TRINITY_DN16209_c0_g1_i2.p1  ORF type:complete len:104 (-),score=18.00 TRINITY_DN16209_c0_g1_i2:155-466(-)